MGEETEIFKAKETPADRALKKSMEKKFEAEAASFDSQTQMRLQEIELNSVRLERVNRERQEELCGNKYHHEYYFNVDVDPESVSYCISMLALWQRIDLQERKKSGEPLDPCDIKIVFNSRGGDIISGLELYDHIQLMRRHGHHVTTGTMGLAASMASILVQAGDVRWMSREAWMMIHEASFVAMGRVGEVKDRLKWIEKVCERILNIFAERAAKSTNQSFAECKQFLKENWERTDFWLDSDACVKHGYIDEIR